MMLTIVSMLSLSGPTVQLYPSFNQALNVLVPKGVSKGGTVSYIGTFAGVNGTAACQAACIAAKDRCWSFTHFPSAAEPQPTGNEFIIKDSATGNYIQAVRDCGSSVFCLFPHTLSRDIKLNEVRTY